MKIKKLTLNNFMAFENVELDWSDNINIICGENSTGKTTLLKVMYSLIKPLSNGNNEALTKEMQEQLFVKKIQGVFRPDEMKIGRLVSRKQGSNRTEFSVDLEKKDKISVAFGNRQENHADVCVEHGEKIKKYDVIYIPTKEMISTVEHFVALYDEYHIDFEEMYYDLAKLLDRPLSKGPNTTEQNQVLSSLEDIMKGQIVQKNKKFYFKIKGEGEFEMGLLSDGYRKLSMIIYMILSGSLNKNKCFQCGKNRTAQVVKAANGFFGIDLDRTTGPEAIWRNKQGMKAAWREHFEWLIEYAASISK